MTLPHPPPIFDLYTLFVLFMLYIQTVYPVEYDS